MSISELLALQFKFTESIAGLVQHARALGYKIKGGEWLRSDEQAEINAIGFDGRKALADLIRNQFPLLAKKIENNRGNGVRNSVHQLALALDIQLFDERGVWLQDKHPYEQLADWWEAQGPEFKAGVRWGDTPHFSITYGGVK